MWAVSAMVGGGCLVAYCWWWLRVVAIRRRYGRRNTVALLPVSIEQWDFFAGGLAGAALPAGFKGAGPFDGVWGAAPTKTKCVMW